MLSELLTAEILSSDFKSSNFDSCDSEECLPDDRAGLRPSEIVQQKFLSLLPDMPIPVSSLHIRRVTRR